MTLHCSKPIPSIESTSMELFARFRERGTAEHLLTVLKESLQQYGFGIIHIRGIATDGAAVMKKLGCLPRDEVALRPFHHQLCYAHVIYLGVLDTLKGNDLSTLVSFEFDEENRERC